jgi:hypothetical protein
MDRTSRKGQQGERNFSAELQNLIKSTHYPSYSVTRPISELKLLLAFLLEAAHERTKDF